MNNILICKSMIFANSNIHDYSDIFIYFLFILLLKIFIYFNNTTCIFAGFKTMKKWVGTS